jgi:hypothetical protein
MAAVDHTNVDPIALGAALAYAARGLRVVPILPGKKYPDLGEEWQKKATNDQGQVRTWWARNPDYGVGIRTGWYGDRCVFVLDVDNGTDKNGRIKEGDESLADLEDEYGALPTTVEAHTPSGGRHIYMWAPVEIRNDQAARLGVDLDIRGEGGQVLAPPTMRPDGSSYVWVADQALGDMKMAQAPAWLVDLLTATVDQQPRAERKPYDGPPRPGDRFAASVTWPQLLERDGAKFMGRRKDRRTGHDYELWARPGVDDHTSATLYYGGYDLLKVFTPNWPGLEQGKTYSRFGYWTSTRYGGDFNKATAELGRQQNDEDIARWISAAKPLDRPAQDANEPQEAPGDAETGWERQSLADVLNGSYERPRPSILRRRSQ